LPSWLEADVRAGIAYVDYTPEQLGDNPDLTGASLFVDAELGWRHGRWSVSAFSSYLYHPDKGSAPGTSVGYDDTDTWNVRLHVIEVGVRGTFHLGRLSFGAGFVPVMFGRAYGTSTAVSGPGNGPCPPGIVATISYTSWDTLYGGELHVGWDLGAVEQLPLQLFGLVEYAQNTDQNDDQSMTSVRIGLGAAF
jgi:hypothetical protein